MGFSAVKPSPFRTSTSMLWRREYFGDLLRNFRMIQTVSGSLLDGDELSGIVVVLHIAKRFNHQRVAGDEANAPSRHVVGFGQGVKLHANILRSRDGEEAQWLQTIVSKRSIRRVMNNHHAIFAGPLDNLGEEFGRGAGPRRVVRIVQV